MKQLPRWSLDSIFPGLDSPKFIKAKRKLEKDLTRLETFCATNDVRAGKKQKVTKEVTKTLNTLIDAINALAKDVRDIRMYLYLITSTDSFNEQARAEASYHQDRLERYGVLRTCFIAWFGRFESEKLLASEKAKEHRYGLEQALELARHLMREDAEELRSSLDAPSNRAWVNLQNDLVSRVTITVNLTGKTQAYTVTELRNFSDHKDATLRQAAFEAERSLLSQHELSFAAALNSVKGHNSEVSKRRGWTSALEQALFANSINVNILEAMHEACREAFPYYQRYLKAKAKLLGKPKLAWYDLEAPLPLASNKTYSWSEAQTFVLEHFRSYSDNLASYAKRTFDEQWHDAAPRKGKTGGAYCQELYGVKEARFSHNFTGSLSSVFTLAHELGHGYHHDCICRANRTLIQAAEFVDPMTLAETASIFCETLMMNALLEHSSPQEKLLLLEQDLMESTSTILDIHSRFLFERAVFEKRLERELSVAELKSTMLEAQHQTFGTTLSVYHDLVWAPKSHYYELDFYNFPYTFGYLFALGLYAEYRHRPEGFHERYDALLSSTGMANAQTLARRFGINLESVDFWRRSLDIVRERVLEFEKLAKTFKR